MTLSLEHFYVPFAQVTNIDGVLENHNDFLDRCLKDCMLTNLELLKARENRDI